MIINNNKFGTIRVKALIYECENFQIYRTYSNATLLIVCENLYQKWLSDNLFFAVNPLYSIVIGIFAGRNFKEMWSLPVISSVLFLLGTWIFFDMGERAFLLYAGIYLIIGIVVMLVSTLISKRALQKTNSIDF